MSAQNVMLLVPEGETVFDALRPPRISIVVRALPFYLATTLLAMRRTVLESRRWVAGFMLMALIVDALGIHNALLATSSGRLNDILAVVYFLFASVDLAAALLDARVLLKQPNEHS